MICPACDLLMCVWNPECKWSAHVRADKREVRIRPDDGNAFVERERVKGDRISRDVRISDIKGGHETVVSYMTWLGWKGVLG